jgi:hypothetical protein
MEGKKAILGVVMFFTILTGSAWAGMAVPVSPGGGTELTAQSCPTFSWSASIGAQSYRVEVYEEVTSDILDRDSMREIGNPVVKKEILAPALSWTPSTGECLSRGMRYVWYVEGVDAEGEGQWSEGQGFQVEAAALSVEQKEAVQDVVKGYLSGESSDGETTSGATEQSKTTDAITPMSYEGFTNSFFGTGAGAVTTGSYDTFIGAYAGNKNTTGNRNSFLGYYAGYSNTTGDGNSFLGYGAGYLNTTGNANSFIGAYAGDRNTTGYNNSFLGNGAGYYNTTGYDNSFIGYDAGYSNTSGYNNSFIGFRASYLNTTGYYNSSLGTRAGYSNTTGDYNSFLGSYAGYNNTTGNRNVFLGYKAGYSETGSNKLYIDNCYTGGSCTHPLIEGDFAARTLEIDGSLTIDGVLTVVSVAAPSDIRYKKDIHPLKSSLEKVLKLRGVTYEWDKNKVHWAGFKEGRQIGLIAQEVEKVFPELVHTDSNGYKTLSYDKLGPVLIEAVKEQQREIEEKDDHFAAALKEKDARIERLEEALDEQKKSLDRQQAVITAMMTRLAAVEHPAKTLALK